LRAALLALCLFAVPTVSFAEGAAHGEHAGEHPSLSFKRILLADVGEGASDEEKAEAKHETLSFWGAVLNFSLLVYLIRRMSKKPLQAFLDGRRREVEKGIAEAAEMKQKAEAVFVEYSERMKTLDQELDKLRTDIAKAAEADKARIVADAQESAKRMRAETQAQIAVQAEQIEGQLRREVVDAAVAAAERAVRAAASADDQGRLAEAFARELAKAGMEKRA
jgi:F-type H+-transporting ATPase subunit b